MNVAFIEAKQEEAHFLSEMRRIMWQTTYRGIYPDDIIDEFDYGFHDDKNLSMINSEEFSVYFVTADGETAGYLILQHKDPLYIQSLYFLPEFRGKGLGRKAFEFIREHCRKNKIKRFYLGCHPENVKAAGFYKKMGGVVTAEDLGHKNNKENNIRFEFKI